jgi:hypothetical protein
MAFIVNRWDRKKLLLCTSLIGRYFSRHGAMKIAGFLLDIAYIYSQEIVFYHNENIFELHYVIIS